MQKANSTSKLRLYMGQEEPATQLEELAISVEELAILHAVRQVSMHAGQYRFSPFLPPYIRGMRKPQLSSAPRVVGTTATLPPGEKGSKY